MSKWISDIVSFIMLASFQKAHHSFASNRQMLCVVTGLNLLFIILVLLNMRIKSSLSSCQFILVVD